MSNSIEIRTPELPESVADAKVLAWHKSAGDSVVQDENLADLETDKVVLEVPAPADGVLEKILADAGAVVNAGTPLAVLDAAADGGAASGDQAEQEAAEAAGDGAGRPATEPAADGNGSVAMSPAVRRLLEEHDLDISSIRGSGKRGRVLKRDVLAVLSSAAGAATAARVEEPDTVEADAGETVEAPPAPATPATPAAQPARQERRETMSRLRARIAQRMVESQREAAMLTTFNDADMSAVLDLRRRHGEAFEARHGVRIGFMSFFVAASVAALKRFPVVNASVEGDEIVYHDYYDIGVAVSTDRGLLVPVLRDADRLSFADIEQTIGKFASRARAGTIGLDELTGGTFTITNGGVFGSLMSTPILNPPQSGILGMHRIEQRAVVVDGEIVARPMMHLALSYDHRIVDGREAVLFLSEIKKSIEDPARMILSV
ncbi:MAG: 2-oxoglutarate dehydrogenase complex dihydrolipoyllysine-residue succinyltransferase [Gammaproteobacteria bacterium]|nr:2-oxoglutarate dehydrogenase complex dihydrolipoyllysine-residue succinyltransferase [Gammaproteobacteria bacterium]MDE0414554.1 2-oxoglutarate dehydrogenase complex dihydrolipoyllysine-residue succinyltransferase [Gammaproteobacteria bacterium]MDE0453891.1 2-oxoglutarate dehydrogenase complex dihydrolipoyllysine-residue succinyltransferase [Gammaproteobacteria bacterium]